MSLDNLPVEWIFSNVGKVLNNTNNLRKPVSSKEREKIKGDYPYYGATGKIDALNSYTHDGEYILMGEDGANLLSRVKDQAFVVKGKFWVNNHAHSLQASCGMPSNFFAYYLNQVDLKPFITGSAQPKLTRQNLDSIPMVVVPLAEQQEIVRQLDVMLAQVEQIKARLDAIPAILKKFRQSVLADAVSGKLIEQDFSNLDFLKLESLILDSGNGLSKRKGDSGNEITVLRLADFKDAQRISGNERSILLTEKELQKYKLLENDILVVRVNGSVDIAGKFILHKDNAKDEAYCDHFIRLRVDQKKLLPEYLLYIANEGKGRDYLVNSLSTSAGQNTINQASIKGLKLRVPEIKYQDMIVQTVEKLFKHSFRIEKAVQSAQKRVNLLTQSILAKAFSGELTAEWREQHQDLITGINSAESLLAKIQAEREASKPVKKTRVKKEA